MKREITDWGEILYYQYPFGRFALYMYNDDNTTIYLSNIKIYNKYKSKGYGNIILNTAISESYKKAKNICLKCKSNSWVHDWYLQNGFIDLTNDNNYKWMIKYGKR